MDNDLQKYADEIKKQMDDLLAQVQAKATETESNFVDTRRTVSAKGESYVNDIDSANNSTLSYGSTTKQNMDVEFNKVREFAQQTIEDIKVSPYDFEKYIKQSKAHIDQLVVDATNASASKVDQINKIPADFQEYYTNAKSGIETSLTEVDEHLQEVQTLGASVGQDVTEYMNLVKNNQVYSKTQTDNLLRAKANTADVTTLNTNIDKANNRIDQAHQALNQVNDRISNFPKGNPSGVYATLAALKTAFPNGNSNIYVISEDGNWYYWSGSAWSSGGKYQETGIAENSIDSTKLMAETIQRHNLSETYVNGAPGANLFDKNNVHFDKYINYKFKLDNAVGYVATNYIYVSGQSKLTFKRITHYAFYDFSYTPITYGTNPTLTTTTIDVPAGAAYIIFSFAHNKETFPLDTYMCNYGDTLAVFEPYGGKLTLENIEPQLADKIKSVPYGKIVEGIPSKNLLNNADFTVGLYVDPSTGKPLSSADYSSNFGKPIKVNGGQAYTIRNVTFYCFYDGNNHRLSGGSNGSNGELTINAPQDAANLVVSYSNSLANIAIVVSGLEIGKYESYGGKLTLENMESNLADKINSIPYGKIVEGSPSKNLLNTDDFTNGSYVDPSTGKSMSNSDYSSNFGKPIKVNGGQAYTIRNITFYCFYDNNNKRLSGGSNGSNGELTINAPENAANLIVSYSNSLANTAIVVSGLKVGKYESYGLKLPANALPVEIRDQFSDPVKNISKTLIVDSSKTENAKDGVYTNLRTAFDSITDSAVNKQYEIIVYDNEINFEDLYPHANWHGGYYGLIAKDYVWITSADPDNPSKHVLKWDGHESLADDVNLTSAQAMAKSIMHVSKPNLTGAFDGFTLDVKNARYPFHFETAAAGNTWFKLKRCVLKWGGNPKVTGFQGATLGYGVSCGDHFSVEDCVITYTGEGHASTAGHNNGWDVSRMGPAPEVMPNARLTFKNCRFNNTGFRVDTVTSTNFDANRSYDIVTFENCKGIREYVFGLQGSATVSNWQSVKIGTV